MDIPINYAQEHRIEKTDIDDFRGKYFYTFDTKEEATIFMANNEGILIHACNTGKDGCNPINGEWQVWPKEIKNNVVLANYLDEGK